MKTAGVKTIDGSTDTPQDRETRLNRLLGHINARPEQLASPAQMLAIEIDGEVVGHTEAQTQPVYFGLPNEARSISLRDENGAVRAHMLLEQEIVDLDFDGGRITVSVAEGSSRRLIVRCQEGT